MPTRKYPKKRPRGGAELFAPAKQSRPPLGTPPGTHLRLRVPGFGGKREWLGRREGFGTVGNGGEKILNSPFSILNKKKTGCAGLLIICVLQGGRTFPESPEDQK